MTLSTPGVGSVAPPDFYEERHEYTAVIELPHDITDIILEDGALVVNVDVTNPDILSESEVELFTTEPKLEVNRLKMNWTSAEAFCVDKGGHLASVSSPNHWFRIQAEVYESNFWLGGTDEATEGNWTWTDGSKWSGEHWYHLLDGGQSKNCLVLSPWFVHAQPCDEKYSSICSLPTKVMIKSDSQLVFTSENISVPALQFTWATQKESQDEEHPTNQSDVKRNRTEANARVIGGFLLTWQLIGSNQENDSANFEGHRTWKTKQEQDLDMLTIMNLVRQSKIKGVKKEKVWEALLRYRWDSFSSFAPSACLNQFQIAEAIFKTGQKLDIRYDWNIRINEEDDEFGKELYLAVLLCPSHLEEAAKLSIFFKHLPFSYKNTKRHLRTVLAATINNIQPKAGDNIKDFSAINMWYDRLNKRYNFSLGPNILPLLTSDNLTQLAMLDPPYLKAYKKPIQECLNGIDNVHKCDSMTYLIGKNTTDLVHYQSF